MALSDYKKIEDDHYRSKTPRIVQMGVKKGGFPEFETGVVDLYVEDRKVKMAFDGGYGHMKVVPCFTKKDAHELLMKILRSDSPDPAITIGNSKKYSIW